MFSVLPEEPQPQPHQQEANALPQIAPATIQRAQEGLEYARSQDITRMAEAALASAETLGETGDQQRLSGEVRRFVLQVLIRTLFRVKVEFPERIPTTPAVIAPNHISHIDPLLLLAELPARPFYHVLGDGRTLYNHWWKRFIINLAKGVIPLERLWKEELAVMEAAKAGREDLAQLADAIQKEVKSGNSIEKLRRLERIIQGIFARGESLMLFPEGRLGNVEGQLLPLKRGAVIYALRAGVPIVPVAMIGTQNLYFRKQLTVRFGEPLYFPQSNRPKAKEIQAAVDALQAAMEKLLPKDYQEPKGIKCCRHFLNHMFW